MARGPGPPLEKLPPGRAVARVFPNVLLVICPSNSLGPLLARLWRQYCSSDVTAIKMHITGGHIAYRDLDEPTAVTMVTTSRYNKRHGRPWAYVSARTSQLAATRSLFNANSHVHISRKPRMNWKQQKRWEKNTSTCFSLTKLPICIATTVLWHCKELLKIESFYEFTRRNLQQSTNLSSLLHLNDLLFGRTCQNTLLCFLYDAEDSASLLSILSDVLVCLV